MKLNLDKNKKYLLACSYGPDSMALFSLLKNSGYDFEVAHVNYGLRKEADEETNNLIKFCQKNNIICHYIKYEKKILRNVEAVCRKIRYEFFSSLFDQFHYDALLVAHHQDDLIETYLLQKKRQNMPKYFGIAENSILFSMTTIRPLLNYKKSDLLDYCQNNGVPYSIDKTNLEDNFERNKIRHSIVEKMSDEDRLNILKEIIERNGDLNYRFSYINSLNFHNCDNLKALDDVNFCLAINELSEETGSSYKVSKKMAFELRKIILSNRTNVLFNIKGKYCFLKEYGTAKFLIDKPIKYSYEIDKPQRFSCPYFELDFSSDTKNRNVFKEDYPLTIRNAKSSDRYLINGYEVKMNRLFIDWKMPYELRKCWPVILNQKHQIIYIPRYRPDFVSTADCNFVVKFDFLN